MSATDAAGEAAKTGKSLKSAADHAERGFNEATEAAKASLAAAALFAVIGALLLARKAEGPRRRHQPQPPPEASLVEKLVMVARAHPFLSAGAAVAAGIYGLKNPE